MPDSCFVCGHLFVPGETRGDLGGKSACQACQVRFELEWNIRALGVTPAIKIALRPLKAIFTGEVTGVANTVIHGVPTTPYLE